MRGEETQHYCVRLSLIIEDKVNPTYEVSLSETFADLEYKDDAIFIENATIQTVDGWFIVEGDVLESVYIYDQTKQYTLDQLHKRYREPYSWISGIQEEGYIGHPLYSIGGRVFLKETSRERFKFKHAIFREFLDL